MRSLAFYVKFKACFPHGGSPSVDDIVQKSQVTRSAAYRYLRVLKQMGFITKNKNGWYKFMTRKELNKRFRTKHCCTILHNSEDTVTTISYKLQIKLVEEKAAQQSHRIKDFKLVDSCKKGSLAAAKRIAKRNRHRSYEDAKKLRLEKLKHEELLHSASFTYDYIADLLNCSTTTVNSILTEGRKNGYMKTKPLTKPIKRMSSKEYKIHEHLLRKQYPSVFFSNGWVMYRVCTLYEQNKYWVESTQTIKGRFKGSVSSFEKEGINGGSTVVVGSGYNICKK